MIALIPIALLFVEVWLLIEVGSATSASAVMLWCVAAFIAGMWLMRRAAGRVAGLVQPSGDEVSTVMTPMGLFVSRRQRPAVAKGELLDVTGVALAGILLAIPGLVSDVIGLFLLVPPLRRVIIGRVYGVRVIVDPAASFVRASRTQRKPHASSADVEVLPPGALPKTPFRKPPVVIDVD
jgi:UPF0716 protein FxsA